MHGTVNIKLRTKVRSNKCKIKHREAEANCSEYIIKAKKKMSGTCTKVPFVNFKFSLEITFEYNFLLLRFSLVSTFLQ